MLSKATIDRVNEILDDMFDNFLDDENVGIKMPLKNKSKDHDIPVNIYDNDDKSVIVALVPGEVKSNVNVELSDDLTAIEITVSNQIEPLDRTDKNMLILKHSEFDDRRAMTAKKYTHKRSVAIINRGVYDLEKITSNLDSGILYITLPKLMKAVKKDKPVIKVN